LRAAQEAQYAGRVALAMRFATQGYNRDVVRGVLLAHECSDDLACRIADSALALHASRQAEAESAEPEKASPDTHTMQQEDRQQEEDPAPADRVRFVFRYLVALLERAALVTACAWQVAVLLPSLTQSRQGLQSSP
jgi:hypothetical protein